MAKTPTYKGKYIGPDKYKGKAPSGGSYKGKYIGPDKYKGKPPTTAKPPKPAAAAKPPNPGAAPQISPGGTQNAPLSPTGVTSNATGNVQLQSTYELNKEELDAQQEYEDSLSEFKSRKERSVIDAARRRQQLAQYKDTGLGKINSNMAYRGMGYSTAAADKIGTFAGEVQTEANAIDSEEAEADSAYGSRAQAGLLDRRDRKLGAVKLGRQDYTNKQSATSPSEGSSPVDSGVKVIEPTKKAPAKIDKGKGTASVGAGSSKPKKTNASRKSAAQRRLAKEKAAKEKAAKDKAANRNAAKRRVSK